ncbi:MAG: hypothetical protein Q8P67_00950, partial [archaeon]|nr:hypothetical protein [archaeon]
MSSDATTTITTVRPVIKIRFRAPVEASDEVLNGDTLSENYPYLLSGDDLRTLGEGEKLGPENLGEEGLRQCVHVPAAVDCRQIGLVLPEAGEFDAESLLAMVGGDREVFFPATANANANAKTGMRLDEWVGYFKTEAGSRSPPGLRSLPLELGGLRLASCLRAPTLARETDWLEHCWPPATAGRPSAPLLCHMRLAGDLCDFAPQQGGAAAWHYQCSGRVRFFLAPPTAEHRARYQERHHGSAVGFLVTGASCCYEVSLEAGAALVVPAGWLVASTAVSDSISFSGTWLSSPGIPAQLWATEIDRKASRPSAASTVALHWHFARSLFLHSRDADGLLACPPFLRPSLPHLDLLIRQLFQWSRDLPHAIPSEVPDPLTLLRALASLLPEPATLHALLQPPKITIKLPMPPKAPSPAPSPPLPTPAAPSLPKLIVKLAFRNPLKNPVISTPPAPVRSKAINDEDADPPVVTRPPSTRARRSRFDVTTLLSDGDDDEEEEEEEEEEDDEEYQEGDGDDELVTHHPRKRRVRNEDEHESSSDEEFLPVKSRAPAAKRPQRVTPATSQRATPATSQRVTPATSQRATPATS